MNYSLWIGFTDRQEIGLLSKIAKMEANALLSLISVIALADKVCKAVLTRAWIDSMEH